MKVRLFSKQQTSLNRQHWLIKPLGSGRYRHWLIGPDSLTAKLKRRYPDFSLQPLVAKKVKVIQDEALLLGSHYHGNSLIREVLLYGERRPVVFAHSVLPKNSLRGEWCRLGRLGNKPLGEALFANPKVVRTPLMYKKLSSNHPLYNKAIANLDMPPAYLWARRSVFSLACAHILVTEVFLPDLIQQ